MLVQVKIIAFSHFLTTLLDDFPFLCVAAERSFLSIIPTVAKLLPALLMMICCVGENVNLMNFTFFGERDCNFLARSLVYPNLNC